MATLIADQRRAIRHRRHWDMTQRAIAIQRTPSVISKWEAGYRTPTAESIDRIIAGANLNPHEIANLIESTMPTLARMLRQPIQPVDGKRVMTAVVKTLEDQFV